MHTGLSLSLGRAKAGVGVSGLPAFSLDFSTGSEVVAGGTKSFARATAATYTDSKGQVQSASSGVLRSAHYAPDGTLLGALIEGASTNICLQSENFSATWTDLGTPLRTAAFIACGIVDLDKLHDDSTGIAEGKAQVVSFTGDGVKALSLYVCRGTSTSALIRLRDSSLAQNRLVAAITWGANNRPIVTMTTGTLLGVEHIANGVSRLRFQTTSVTAANTNQIEIYPATDAALTVTNTGWTMFGGVQVENAAFCSSYIPTTTGTVARNADVLSYTGLKDTKTQGTMLVEYADVYRENITSTDNYYVQLGNNTTDDLSLVAYAANTRVNFRVRSGSADQANVSATSGSLKPNIPRLAAMRWKANSFQLCHDMLLGTEDTAGAAPTVANTQINIGVRSGSYAYGCVKRVVLYDTYQSDATLQSLTANDLLFYATHERGDLTEWDEGFGIWSPSGSGGEFSDTANGADCTIDSTVAYRGAYSAKMSDPEAASGARLHRWGYDDPPEQTNHDLYHSGWYYFPSVISFSGASPWFQILQMKQELSAGGSDPIWFCALANAGGANQFQLHWSSLHTEEGPESGEGPGFKSYTQASPINIPIGHWFHLEMRYVVDKSNGFGGRIQVWQDGTLIFDLSNIKTYVLATTTGATNGSFTIATNSYGDDVTPDPAVVYVDSFKITRTSKADPDTSFAPTDFPGLAAWYKFNTGITEAGTGVSQWDDQSGNARHLLQGTDSKRPTKETDGTITFNGTSDILQASTFTLEQPVTVYLLMKQVSYTTNKRIFDGNATLKMALYQGGTSPNLNQYAGVASSPNGNLAVGSFGALCAVFDGVNSVLRVNNTASVVGNVGTATAIAGFTLGARPGTDDLNGNIQVKEVLIYQAAHTDREQNRVIRYLNSL